MTLGGFCVSQFLSAKEHTLTHDFARCEFDDGARGDFHSFERLLGVTTDSFFGEANFKHSEIAELHIISCGEALGDSLKCQLNNAENLLLSESGFFANFRNEIVFCEI